MRLLLCYISCLVLIQFLKKWPLHTEAYGKEEDLNKESRKAYLCILNFSYMSKVNRSQSMVRSSVKLRLCIKNFAWSVKAYTIRNYMYSFCKCPSKALSFSPSGFVKMCTFWGAAYQPCFSELIAVWTNALHFNFFFFTVPQSPPVTMWWESDNSCNVVLWSPAAFQNLSNMRILYCSLCCCLG